MAAALRHGVASWPGAFAVEFCTYTLSHGISPGVANIRIHPQDGPPANSGTLVIGDGVGAITLPDCKLDQLTVETDDAGRFWSITILDRRWKWRDLGNIEGDYNQQDKLGKLIPWTIRSPRELAILCLEAMGETGYVIDLPPGLTEADGIMHGQRNPPHIGVIPTTGTNPNIVWQPGTPPAVALNQLCELFGRRVVYRWQTNSVAIVKPGVGGSLPGGSIASSTPSIDDPETPTGVGVIGDPTIYQMKIGMEAVGEEWNGHFLPIDMLSYAPLTPGKPQITKITITSPESGDKFQVFLNPPDNDPPITGVLFEHTAGPSDLAADVADALKTAINASADPRVRPILRATSSGGEITLTGRTDGEAFGCYVRLSGVSSPDARIDAIITQVAQTPRAGWSYCTPPNFSAVRATDRLTKPQAMALAQKWIFKAYRVKDTDVTGAARIHVPGYGRLSRRQQIMLTDKQAEQVVPEDFDRNLRDRRGLPFGDLPDIERRAIINLYNGYSRDKPAACFGSISKFIETGHNIVYANLGSEPNTPAGSQIFVDFSVEPVEQLVVFSTYVYSTHGALRRPADVVLLTGVMIRNARTNAIERYRTGRLLPGMRGLTNYAIRHYPDVQLNVIGQYDEQNNVTGARVLELDPLRRADYYLTGMSDQYLTETALTNTYNGIMNIDCDGAISQVTWSIGGNGPDDAWAATVASRNSEHSIYFPPYPARRRAENLPPVHAQNIAMNNPRIGAALMDSLNRPG